MRRGGRLQVVYWGWEGGRNGCCIWWKVTAKVGNNNLSTNYRLDLLKLIFLYICGHFTARKQPSLWSLLRKNLYTTVLLP